MKFNCDYFKNKREKKLKDKLKKMKNWSKVFLILPVKIADNDCRWLEYAEVRYPNAKLYPAINIEFLSNKVGYISNLDAGSIEYRAIESINNDKE